MNKYIDHTVLKATASQAAVKQLCEEAREHHFASVCVNPVHVPMAAELLAGSDVDVCTVIGFPLGANRPAMKVAEAELAIQEGATEIDMVINIGAALEHRYEDVQAEIAAVVETAKDKALVKVILETCYLGKEEIAAVSACCVNAGADFVKTSTGFGTGGATAEDVRLMKETVGDAAQVKASGGIRTKEDAEKMIEAGATRIGASCGVKLVTE